MLKNSLYQFEEPISLGFLKSVLSFPERNAVFVAEQYYSYQRLWELVDFIYRQIPTDKTYQTIGIYCNNDIFTYASILAVNLYGAAYVPLNQKFPAVRNKNYIEQCALKLILSSSESVELTMISKDVKVIFTKVDNHEITKRPFQFTSYKKTEQPISYILFTSGTTGIPKGVPVSHSNANYFFNFFLSNYDFNEKDRFLQVYELTFDGSVFSFFMPLLVGACCYVLPDEGIKVFKIPEYLKNFNITVVILVPSVLRYIEQYIDVFLFPALRYSFFAGEALFYELVMRWKKSLPNGNIHNFYGPTETTILCTRYEFDEKKSNEESINGIVPLGKLFEGMSFMIVDENNQPIDKGELCIAGHQVISGYLNNQNQDRFFIRDSVRYYKTGDMVSLNKNGNLIFYGRTDRQVKINGFRVELGEIENTISNYTKTNVVVMCNSSENNMNKLIAYIETKTINENSLIEELRTFLPNYMIPQNFIPIEKFALNLNGKIDREKFKNI